MSERCQKSALILCPIAPVCVFLYCLSAKKGCGIIMPDLSDRLLMPNPARWRTPLCLAPRSLRPWLADTGSLTARLKSRHPDLRVQVLKQGWLHTHRDEQRALHLRRPQIQVATREVLLLDGDIPLVFAHSITVRASLRGGFHLFGRVGSRPLGELLFADPTITRSALAWRCIDCRHPLWRKADTAVGPLPARLWARRSVFLSGGDRLLVTEVFLPAIEFQP